MDVQIRKLSQLKHADYNPRKKLTEKDDEHQEIAKSIDEFGYVDPIIINADNTIIGGHQRATVLKDKGFDEILCVVLDLPKNKEKSLNVALNKIKGEWDELKLAELLDSLDDYDTTLTGFDSQEIADIMEQYHGACVDLNNYVGDYKQTKNLDNLFKSAPELGHNEWDIPTIKPFTEDLSDIEWISFGEKASITDPSNTGIHFYIDDYKFDSVWKSPDKWLGLFQKCRAVVTPDFSNYTDMPKAQQLWNHYRRQWLGKYWQDNGVNVICSLSWAVGQIYDWSFEGIPKGTICATSFVGDEIDKEFGIEELLNVIEIVNPCKLLIKANAKDAEILRKHVDFDLIPPYNWRKENAKR